MSVFRRRAVVASAPPRPVRAAATPIDVGNRGKVSRLNAVRRSSNAWQEEAWKFYDEIGEIKYAFGMLGNIASRVRIFPAVQDDIDDAPVALSEVNTLPPGLEEICTSLFNDLAKSWGGIPEIVRSSVINFCVTGECYLLRDRSADDELRWRVRLTSEVKDFGDQIVVKSSARSELGQYTLDKRKDPKIYLGRMWRPHPQYTLDADSSMRGVLDLCDELLLLSKMNRAVSRSRLNAGMLVMPDGFTASRANPEDEDTDLDTDDFEDELLESMSEPIKDESSASAIVPLVVRGPGDEIVKIRFISFARDADGQLVNRADRVLDRIMQSIDVPKDVVTGYSSVKYCASDDTEILTKTGWKTHDQLAIGDIVWTLNAETGLGEWQPATAVNRFEVVDEPMLAIDLQGHSSLTTLDHSWPVAPKNGPIKFLKSRELSYDNRFLMTAPAAELPVEQKYSDALVELVAWHYTEGHVMNFGQTTKSGEPRRRWIAITQSLRVYPENVASIRRALTEIFGPAYVTLSSKDAADYGHFSSKGLSTPAWRETVKAGHAHFYLNEEAAQLLLTYCEGKDKIVRRDFIESLTKAQLDLFIQTSIAADGHGDMDGGAQFGQHVEARLEPFELACYLAGRPIQRRGIKRSDWYDVWLRKSRITINPYQKMSEVSYTGTVWCPTTANHTWFARRNGTVYFTGNSNATHIDENMYKAHVEPLLQLVCDSLCQVYLRPMLVALGFGEALARRITVWYDPTEVLTRPDRSADAEKGYQDGIIGPDAWRREHGFSKKDAPTPADLVVKILVDKALMSPELVADLLRYLAPETFANLTTTAQVATEDALSELQDFSITAPGEAPTATVPEEAPAPMPSTLQPEPEPETVSVP